MSASFRATRVERGWIPGRTRIGHPRRPARRRQRLPLDDEPQRRSVMSGGRLILAAKGNIVIRGLYRRERTQRPQQQHSRHQPARRGADTLAGGGGGGGGVLTILISRGTIHGRRDRQHLRQWWNGAAGCERPPTRRRGRCTVGGGGGGGGIVQFLTANQPQYRDPRQHPGERRHRGRVGRLGHAHDAGRSSAVAGACAG